MGHTQRHLQCSESNASFNYKAIIRVTLERSRDTIAREIEFKMEYFSKNPFSPDWKEYEHWEAFCDRLMRKENPLSPWNDHINDGVDQIRRLEKGSIG